MKQLWFSSVLLLSTCLSALAQAPDISIVGPTGGVPGDLLILQIESQSATHVTWTVTPELPDGRVTILPIEQSRKAILCSVPGTYTVICAASCDTGIAIKKHIVTVSGQVDPDQDREDKPQPKPQPKPPSRYGLDQQVSSWLAGVDKRSGEEQRLASNLEFIAGRIERGELTKLDGTGSIQEATFNGNREVLSDEASRQRWLPFFAAQQAALRSLSESGRMVSPADYAVAWREIASGLRGGVQ